MKSERQKREEYLIKMWAECIKLRDKRCWRCGRTDNLQANHIISRNKKSTKFLLENGFTLCKTHHLYWWHKNQPEIGHEVWEWFQKQIGKSGFPIKTLSEYDKLRLRSRELFTGDLFKWEIYLKNKLLELKNSN